jgi:beta-lactamase class A
MIVVSDDLAANLLITLCGPEAITRTAQALLGAPQTTVLRCVEDLAAFRAGGMNWTTARDQIAIYHALHTGAAASPAACAEMRAILLRQQINNVIPALLPPGTPVAHKTGAITSLRHDAGTILAPFATWHLALLSDRLPDPAQGIQALAELSRLVYDTRAELTP